MSGTTTARTIRERLGISPEEFAEMGRTGAMYYRQGSYDKARAIFEGLVDLDPESAHAHAALGAILTLQQEDDSALEHLRTAVMLDPGQIAPYVNLGEVYLRRKSIEDAVANLRKAIELDPHESDPGANRARAMVMGIYQMIRSEEDEAGGGDADEIGLANENIN